MRYFKNRKKSWRKFRVVSSGSRFIRLLCLSVLVLELAFFVREYTDGGMIRVSSSEELMVEDRAPKEKGEQTEYEKTYGIDIRLKDGQIDFYRKEELKSTN